MGTYQKPAIKSESARYVYAVGQYIFEVTANACPGLAADGAVSSEDGLAFCASGAPASPGFTASISCQNISGTFNAVYGDAVSGGGLSCSGLDQSAIYPLLSFGPDLPENCIVESFILNGSNQC